MVRTLQAFGVLALISACFIFVVLAVRQLQGATEAEQNPGLSILEKFKQAGISRKNTGKDELPPLVRQAEAFALYLNPPEPPKSKEAPAPKAIVKQTKPATSPPKLNPKFRVLATSCYRSRPEKSMALVSEPGREPRWVKQGTHLGHFVVEKVERGMLVYRQGNRLGQMAIDTKVPVPAEQEKQTMLASNEASESVAKPASPRKTGISPTRRRPMHRLGLGRPETRPVAYASSSG